MKDKILFIVFFASVINITFAQHRVSENLISSGGANMNNATYSLSSSTGEAFIGSGMNTDHKQYSGFWNVYQQTIITGIEEEETVPTIFKLDQNYPNPFNPSTIIRFTIPSPPLSLGEGLRVRLVIYDILGNEIVTLVDEYKPAGKYEIKFNAASLSSGIYLLRLEAGEFIGLKKMICLK